MKQDIHPTYKDVIFSCSCGNKFTTRSTIEADTFNVEVCAKCHPFYTGKQKLIDTSGQVDKFQKRFGGLAKKIKKDEQVAEG